MDFKITRHTGVQLSPAPLNWRTDDLFLVRIKEDLDVDLKKIWCIFGLACTPNAPWPRGGG